MLFVWNNIHIYIHYNVGDTICEEYFKGLPKRAQISSFTFYKVGRRKIYHLTFKKKDVTKSATCEVRTKMYPIPIC